MGDSNNTNVTGLNILLVDDDEDDCRLFKEVLDRLGETHVFSSGNNSDNLFTLIEETLPDIIFMDINMPGKNGIRCLKEIKTHAAYSNIPVIMYSVSEDEGNQEECRLAGAHHYIVKPYALINLQNALKRVFSRNWRIAQTLPGKDDFVIGLEFQN